MVSQTKSLKSREKEPFFVDLKVGKDLTKYKAWVGTYVVEGVTSGPKDKVKAVVRRMAQARAVPHDNVKALVEAVTNQVMAAIESGSKEVGVVMGNYFHLGEYMRIVVKIERIYRPHGTELWGMVRVMFRGDDGLKALARHVVWRYIDFYPNSKVNRDMLYEVLLEAATIAYNAYARAVSH